MSRAGVSEGLEEGWQIGNDEHRSSVVSIWPLICGAQKEKTKKWVSVGFAESSYGTRAFRGVLGQSFRSQTTSD